MVKGKTKIHRRIDLSRMPTHLAIIMDGNGRWATKRGLPRNLGHKAGCENIKRIIQNVYDLGIRHLSFFAFSTENWKRPQEEIDGIFSVIRDYLKEDSNEFPERDIRVVGCGDLSKLPSDLVDAFRKVEEKTKSCTTMVLNLAVNYGGRDEILRAANLAMKEGAPLNSHQDFAKFMYTANLPDPDFVIRTSGEMRLSNFMLWQMAYSELYFTPTYWPSFSNKELQRAIISFQSRKRRFGGIKNN